MEHLVQKRAEALMERASNPPGAFSHDAEHLLVRMPDEREGRDDYVFVALPRLSEHTTVELAIAPPHIFDGHTIFADNLSGCGVRERMLTLEFHLVVLFASHDVSSLRLNWGGLDYELEATRLHSPYLGERYPHIPWAGHARFSIRDTVRLLSPDRIGYIVAEAGGRSVTLAVIRFQAY